ncbi:hypothetical protein AAFF_G00122150 [Aldrovandia affinis]|uniref:Uncharacterized protein n=1 Tax=Aldrovandia affinis TaxID=143900 RepID=A0AAD7RS56_9TELE|nr:hypothetical protein AAFF_G00122150 [Aldrovandia affinis]
MLVRHRFIPNMCLCSSWSLAEELHVALLPCRSSHLQSVLPGDRSSRVTRALPWLGASRPGTASGALKLAL